MTTISKSRSRTACGCGTCAPVSARSAPRASRSRTTARADRVGAALFPVVGTSQPSATRKFEVYVVFHAVEGSGNCAHGTRRVPLRGAELLRRKHDQQMA